MKSGDLKKAIALFNSIQVKTNPLYITLFKGRYLLIWLKNKSISMIRSDIDEKVGRSVEVVRADENEVGRRYVRDGIEGVL